MEDVIDIGEDVIIENIKKVRDLHLKRLSIWKLLIHWGMLKEF